MKNEQFFVPDPSIVQMLRRAQLRMKTNRGAPPARAQSTNNGGLFELLLYGEIDDFFGISASDVAQQLQAAGEISEILVRINSPGGFVFDGAAIYNLLVSQGVPVNVVIDGLAASSASYVAMAGKTVTMGEGSMLMIHNPWSLAIGNAGEMRKMADVLDKVRDSMLPGYMKRYSGTQDELKAALDAETWLTADDAKKAGLCDEIAGTDDGEEDPNARATAFDLSIFRNVPKNLKSSGRKPKAEITCPCQCAECVAGNCAGCSDPNCDYTECKDCPQQMSAHAAAVQKVLDGDHYRMRLKLHERLAGISAK